MNHIRDKKMWWVVNFCRPDVNIDPGPVFSVLGLASAMIALTLGAMAILAFTHGPGPALAIIPLVGNNNALMRRLERRLGAMLNPNWRFYNDPTPVMAAPESGQFADKIEDLQGELLDLSQKMTNIQATAKAEQNRSLTEAESISLDAMLSRFDAVYNEIERRQRIARAVSTTQVSAGRRTSSGGGTGTGAERESYRPASASPNFANDRDKWGWRTFGEFARSVKNAMRPGSNMSVDPRLIANVGGPDVTGNGETNEDGGFAVPPDFRREIMQKIAGEDSLLARTDGYTTESNMITFPTDETAPWQSSGGIQAYWLGEGEKKTQSKPALKSFDVKLHKLAALIPMTDEILDDAAVMTTYLRRKAPDVIGFKVNHAIINGLGDGSLMPFGMLGSAARVTVERNTSSPASPFTFDDAVNMWTRLFRPCRANAIWLINQSIETAMLKMAFPGAGTAVPVYLPPGGLSQTPYGTLLGRPVIPTEACAEVGTEGDIILCDLKQYVTAQKVGGMRQDISMHLFFDYDITAFRFVLRVGGKPWWSAPVSAAPGSENSPSTAVTRSCYVTLGDEA